MHIGECYGILRKGLLESTINNSFIPRENTGEMGYSCLIHVKLINNIRLYEQLKRVYMVTNTQAQYYTFDLASKTELTPSY